MRLLQYLRSKLGPPYSLRMLKQALENNACEINGRIEHFGSTLVGWGDRIRFLIPTRRPSKPSFEETVPILFEDEDFLIINKPAGLQSEDIPSLSHLKSNFLSLAHRLDKETSGVLILVKSERAKSAMFHLFKERSVIKTYLAIVEGTLHLSQGRISNYLGKISSYQGQSIRGAVDKEKGAQAITTWKLIKKGKLHSLLECSPLTGRTHQIRAHLASLGHAILGDSLYNKSLRTAQWPDRCLLHAAKISFIHPYTLMKMEIEAALPPDFNLALKNL